ADDQAAVQVGSLVRVPFGRSRAVGVVVELAGNSRVEPEQLAEPEAVLPDPVPADLVELAGWMATEHCSTSARALGFALAPGARFDARFGGAVAVLHPGQRPARRHDEWARLRGGEARVCVGPRSAVFAPLSEIGLIVIDEEHEGSFKHEGDPGYDARAVAER